MQKPNQTLFLIATRFAARFDFDAKGNEIAFWKVSLRRESSVDHALESLIRVAPLLGKKGWLACSSFWNGSVSISPSITGQLNDSEIQQSLAIEAEPYAEVNIDEIEIASKLLPSQAYDVDPQWWTVLIPKEVIVHAKDRLQRNGCRLRGVGTPFVTAPPSLDPVPPSWNLLQQWGEASIRIATHHEAGTTYVFSEQIGESEEDSNDSAKTETTSSAQFLTFILAENSKHESLAYDESLTLDNTLCFDMEDDKDLKAWANTWMHDRLSGSVAPIFKLETTSKKSSIQIAVMLLFFLLGLACTTRYFWIQSSVQNLRRDIASTEQQKKTRAQLQRELASENEKASQLAEQLSTLSKKFEDLKSKNQTAVHMLNDARKRWSQLLNALSASESDDLWIRELKAQESLVILLGVAQEAASIQHFASELESGVPSNLWSISPPKITDLSDAGLKEFSIALQAKLSSREPIVGRIVSKLDQIDRSLSNAP